MVEDSPPFWSKKFEFYAEQQYSSLISDYSAHYVKYLRHQNNCYLITTNIAD